MIENNNKSNEDLSINNNENYKKKNVGNNGTRRSSRVRKQVVPYQSCISMTQNSRQNNFTNMIDVGNIWIWMNLKELRMLIEYYWEYSTVVLSLMPLSFRNRFKIFDKTL